MTEPLSRSPAIASYQFVLSEEPTHWSLYGRLAALLPTPSEQSHVYLQGAWRALERREYIQAQEFSAAAERVYGRTFRARLIDIEILKRQGQSSAIPKKLLEIAETFKRKNLPAEEVKVYKRVTLLDPNPAYYERVINLYATIGKQEKATLWVQKLGRLKPPIIEKPLAPLPPALPDIAFGKALWAKYFGDVGEEPPLPPDIEKILSSPCPIWPDKKVRETHILVLVPQTVTIEGDGLLFGDKTIKLRLKTLGELVQKPLQGKATKYDYFHLGQYNDPPAPESHWALMSRNVIPSCRQYYRDQQAQVTSLRDKTKLFYEVPTILDATVCIFMEYFRTGTYLYGQDPLIYTRCQEKWDDTWHLDVGGFAPGGLNVCNNRDSDSSGLAVLRKFFRDSLKLPDIAFGKALWAKFFGDVGEEPPLPPDIYEILSGPCPFWEGKKVRETHMLVLVPQTVTITPRVKGGFFSRNKTKIIELNLRTLGEIVKKPLLDERRCPSFSQFPYMDIGEYNDLPVSKSHWALMTRDVLPESHTETYDDQQKLIASYNQKANLHYEVPTILDAAVCIFMEYFRLESMLYPCNATRSVFTRCQEKYNPVRQLEIGNFSIFDYSLRIQDYDNKTDNGPNLYLGVGALRKFF